MSTLLLRLAGPMQSWGYASLFDRRDTGAYPTKSGVIGILAAALGRKRGELLDDLRSLRFGVRIDAPGKIMEDYHINEMKGDDRKYKNNVSHRFYLTDAIFLVGLESDDEKLLETCNTALQNPVYALFLGRKSCPPTGPLTLGIKEASLEDALKDSDWTVPEFRKKRILGNRDKIYLRILVEDDKSKTLVKDNPVSYSLLRREYAYRGIREHTPKTIVSEKREESGTARDIYTTEHDPMKELIG